MKRFKRGLVVGKFCPLHRGHELVIRQAQAACESVVIISYTNPEFPGCEPAKRRQWLQVRFPAAQIIVLSEADGDAIPANDADDGTHRTYCANVLMKHALAPVDAVFTSESYGPGFASALTEIFRQRNLQQEPVTHCLVDLDRQKAPISGTELRADIHGHRAFLAPEVYASFVQRICLLGGESSGKSTLAEALAARYDTNWVPEYGRELWVERNGDLVFADLLHIGQTQVQREESLLKQSKRFLFCDTSPLTTLWYCREYFGQAEPELESLAKRTYESYILCAPDIPFDQDGTRQDEAFRQRQHAFYLEWLHQNASSWTLVEGDLTQRLQAVEVFLE